MCVSGGDTCGPLRSAISVSRLMASIKARRTSGFWSALLLLGEMVLKTMYGLLENVWPR